MGYWILDFVGCFFFVIKLKYLVNILEIMECWKKDICFNIVNNINLIYICWLIIYVKCYFFFGKRKKSFDILVFYF